MAETEIEKQSNSQNIPSMTTDKEIRKMRERELKELGTIWINAAKMNGVRPSDIDKYLWTIGNRMCLKKKCEECPLSKNCQKKQ